MDLEDFVGRGRCILAALLLVLASSWLSGAALGQEPRIAVVYPDVREPYLGVFLKIIGGIEDAGKGSVQRFPIKGPEDVAGVLEDLNDSPPKAVVALGRVGRVAAERLKGKWPVVLGAVASSADADGKGFEGISLSPDPEVLFKWLKTLVPEVRRVTVVYNQKQAAQSIQAAQSAARDAGLTLNALPAGDLRDAAALYRKFLSEASGAGEALWLPQDDATLDEEAMLPVILKEAWEKNLVVFSSAPEHVKRGALFSLYPDNEGMGRSLAALATQQSQGNPAKVPAMRPLRDLQVAINQRAVEHLGLRLPSQDKKKFEIIFPAP